MGERILGYHAIEESLKSSKRGGVLYICRNMEKRAAHLEALAKAAGGITIRKIAKIEMDRMTNFGNHRGALLELKHGEKEEAVSVKEMIGRLNPEKPSIVLILDGITDVHNLGAILRSADQFSVDFVITPIRRSAQQSETVRRISSGASEHVPLVTVPNLVREIETLQKSGYWIYGADMEGESLHTTKFPQKSVIVVGSEGEGLSKLVSKRCDHIISIPTSGNIDSLNVSVATGILLYEMRKQLPAP